MVSTCWIVFVVMAQFGAADICMSPRFSLPRRRREPQRFWTFTPRTALGASDMLCLAGTVMVAAASHRRIQAQRSPETSVATVVPEVVGDVSSQPNASDCPSVGFPSDDATEVEEFIHQSDLPVDPNTDRDKAQDLSRFVGDWSDGVREFSVEPDGQVFWRKAARQVGSFKVREPAKINPSDGSLEFTLEFPPDAINPIGKATWHLGPNTVWQTFEQSVSRRPGIPQPGLTRDGQSSVPVQWKKAEIGDIGDSEDSW